MKSLPIRLVLATFLFALLAAVPSVAFAGPWTKSSGQYYVKVGESFYRATTYRTANGLPVTGADYFSATTYLYAEAGIWENLHLQTFIPVMYSRAVFGSQRYSDFGPGDAQFAIQSSPLNLPFPTAVRLETRIPLYGPPKTPQTPARGDQQVDFALWLSAGGGLYPIPLYFYVDAGYLHRTNWTFGDTVVPDFSDSILTIAQVGYTLFDTAVVALNASVLMALQEDNVSESYVTVGPSLFWPLNDRVALELDSYLTPYARNSAQGWAVGFGMSFRAD